MAKDGRFYMRLTEEERVMLDAIADELGLSGNASAAIRQVMRQKHRELFPEGAQAKRPAKAKKK